MDDVTRLLAYEEIRQLAARYALAIDSRDLNALVALFVDDVRVGGKLEGRAALKEDFDRQLRDVGVSILFVGNHVIDIEDEHSAKGSVYCKAEIQVGERWVQQAILYRDRYAKRGSHWYFVRRIHLLWYGKDAQENPLDLPPADWPENHTGRGTLPESWQSWKQFWETQED